MSAADHPITLSGNRNQDGALGSPRSPDADLKWALMQAQIRARILTCRLRLPGQRLMLPAPRDDPWRMV